jgi:hypothetical protein
MRSMTVFAGKWLRLSKASSSRTIGLAILATNDVQSNHTTASLKVGLAVGPPDAAVDPRC